MKSIYYNLIFFIFITNEFFVESRLKITSRRRRKLPRFCTPTTCHGEGVCTINEFGNAICSCYKQFYSGDSCSEPTDNCFDFEFGCVTDNTDDCWDYYGGRQCYCRRYFYGKRCQNYGYGVQFATYIGAYFSHEPSVNSRIPIYIVFLSLGLTKKITLQATGLTFVILPEQFKRIKSDSLKNELYKERIIPTMTIKPDAIIPQEFFFIQHHYFFHTGKGRVVVNLYTNITKKVALNSYIDWAENKVGAGVDYAFGAWDYTTDLVGQSVGAFEGTVKDVVASGKDLGHSILGYGKEWLPTGVYDYIYQDVQSGIQTGYEVGQSGLNWAEGMAGGVLNSAMSWTGYGVSEAKDYTKWAYTYGRETVQSLSSDSLVGKVFTGVGSAADHLVDFGQDAWTGAFGYGQDLINQKDQERLWEEVVAPGQGPDGRTEITYDLAHKMYTVHLSDNWYYEYNAVVNGSVCSPDLKFLGGVCSTFANLPTTILKTRSYRMDVVTLNRCVGSNITDPVFVFAEVNNETSLTLDQLDSDGTAITQIFQLTTIKPELSYGQIYQIYGQISETDKPSETKTGKTKGTGYGRDMCWFRYHLRLAPVVSTNVGAQVYISTNDEPVIQSYVYFIDDPYKEVTDDLGGKLTYKWTCTTVSYGWIPLHGCDFFFTSHEKTITLNFWSTIKGYIELTACYTVESEVYVIPDYYCQSIKFDVVAYYGVFETWDVPVFFVQCLYNCGEGVVNSFGDVDRGELVFLKTECILRCENIDKYMWILNGLEISDYEDAFLFHENIEEKNKEQAVDKLWNYKMLKPNIMAPSDMFLNVHIIGKHENEDAWGRFILRYFTAPSAQPIFSSNCVKDQTLRGYAYFTDFFLCITNVDPTATMTYVYYVKANEFESIPGLIIGYSQAPYLADVLLGASVSFLQVNILVTNDIYGNSYLDDYGIIEVFPPEERNLGAAAQLSFIKNIFEGKQIKNRIKSSCSLNAERGEMIEFTQKISVILLEIVHLAFSKMADDQIYIETEKRKILVDSLTLLKNVKITMPSDSIQWFTLTQQYVNLFPLPLPYDIVNAMSFAIENALTTFELLVLNDINFYNKPFKVLRLVKPLIETLSAILYPAKSALLSTLSDPMSAYVRAYTKDEIHIQSYEEMLIPEGYSVGDVDETTLKRQLQTYASAVTRSVSSLFQLTSALESCLTPVSREAFPWPALEYTPYRKDIIYLYVKKDFTSFFSQLKFRIGLEKIAFIDFTDSLVTENGNKVISVQVIILQVMPFWWLNTSSFFIPGTLFLRVQEDKNNRLETNFTLRFAISQSETNFIPATAYQLINTPSETPKITCHLAFIKPEYPHAVTVTFKNNIRGKLHVVLRVGKCPTINEFSSKDKVVLIGPGVNKGKDNYLVKYYVSQKKKPIFLFVGVVTNQQKPVTYSIRINGIGCYSWQKVKNSNSTLDHNWQEDCNNPYISYLTKSLLCECRLTSETNIFTGSYLSVPQKIYGWLPVDIDYRLNPSVVVLYILLALLCIFIVTFLFAAVLDSNDEIKKKALFLVDNRVSEQYMYVIVVVTGGKNPSQTTSHIGLKLYGSKTNSKRHILVGVRHEKTLARLGIDFFALTTIHSLGKIRALEVWSDSRGSNPDWFCEKLIVRDYKLMLEWVFVVHKWFSLVKGDAKLHRILYQTKLKTPSLLNRIFQAEDFLIHHIWIGMFFREHCHSFSRKLKVLTCYLILSISLFMCLFLYGVPQLQDNAVYDEGHIHADLAISNGFISLFIAVLIVYPIMYTLKNTEVDATFDYFYYDFSGLDPTVPIPIYFFPYTIKYLMCAIITIIILITFGVTIWVAPSFGIRKSIMALISLAVVFVVDFFFLETIHIFIRGFIWRGIFNKSDTQRFCNQIIDTDCEYDIELANNANKQLMLKKDMYAPMRSQFIKIFQERERCFYVYSSLVKDCLMYVFYIIVLLLILVRYRDSYAYYNSDIMNRIYVEGRFTNTQPLANISNNQEFFDYLNYTILMNTFWQPPCWLSVSNIKLLGVIRLRQHRIPVKERQCALAEYLIHDIKSCQRDFAANIRDMDSYNPKWTRYNRSLRFPAKMSQYFEYRTGEESESYPIYTANRVIPEGGYVVALGRSARNSRSILNMISESNWFDEFTRIIIIEFTTFNIHANVFTLVSIIIEKSMTGDFITTENIKTLVLERRHVMNQFIEYLCYVILTVLIICIIIHQSQNLLRTDLVQGQSFVWFILDVIVLILSILAISYALLKGIYQYKLTDLINRNQRNYINFGYMGSLDYTFKVVTSLLIFLSTFRMWKLLRFNSKLEMIELTLSFALTPLMSITAILLIMGCMSLLILNLIFGSRFRIWWNFLKLPDHTGFYTEGKITLVVLFYLFSLVLKNFYITIIMLSYRKARTTIYKHGPIFKFIEFLDERLMGNDRSEVLRWRLLNDAKKV